MFTRFFQKMLNTINQWVEMVHVANQPAPIPLRVRAHRVESKSEISNRQYRRLNQRMNKRV